MTNMISSIPYPFTVFLIAATLGAAGAMIRNHFAGRQHRLSQPQKVPPPIDELYNE